MPGTTSNTQKQRVQPGRAEAWFCVRSHLKHEHIAAAHLRSYHHLEVFLPRIRFKRSRRQGPVWVTEALFPNYLFARFDWQKSLRDVLHSRGVAGVVHFGDSWPVVPDPLIDDLRATFGEKETHLISDVPEVGDEIQISGGAFHGLLAVVTQVLPSRERVKVLFDFLGRQTAVEVKFANLVRGNERRSVL